MNLQLLTFTAFENDQKADPDGCAILDNAQPNGANGNGFVKRSVAPGIVLVIVFFFFMVVVEVAYETMLPEKVDTWLSEGISGPKTLGRELAATEAELGRLKTEIKFLKYGGVSLQPLRGSMM